MATPCSLESLQNPKDANPYINMIVRTLQKRSAAEACGFKISEVFKGGSLGQGTAVPYEFDLDLIIYSKDIKPSDMLDKHTLHQYLCNIDAFLSVELGRTYKKVNITDHAVTCMLGRRPDQLDVDILVSPHWDNVDDLHSYLKDLSNYKRRMFSCSAAKWQTNFFGQQPDIVREYIKRAKAWRNNKWPQKEDGIGRPKSFLIGLLVVEAYDRSRSGREQSVTDIMKRMVREHKSLQIDFEDALYSSSYKNQFPSHQSYIIDPSNPFNNVYLSGIGSYQANSPEGTYEPGDGDWTMFVAHIPSLDLSEANGTRY